MKTTITKMKTTSEGINSRVDEAEDRITNLDDKVLENTQSKQQKEKKNKKNRVRI